MRIDFYYDFVSPYSYLASLQLPALARARGVELRWVPVRLTRLLELTGNVSPLTVPKKARYLVRDLKRWAARLDAPLHLQHPPFFDTQPALLAAHDLHGSARERFSSAVFAALWGGGAVNAAADPDWLAGIAAAAAFPDGWTCPVDPDGARAALEEATIRAARDGAFGVPAFVLRSGGRRELFFGLDRLDFLAAAAAGTRPCRARVPAVWPPPKNNIK